MGRGKGSVVGVVATDVRADSGFQSLFGARRGGGDARLDSSVPTAAAHDRAQRMLADARAGHAHDALEALNAHRGKADRPLLAKLLADTAAALCDCHVHEQEGVLEDFFASTVRDGRSDRILRVQTEVVRRPRLTPFMLHLWPDGGPDKSAYDQDTEVVTACGLRSGREQVTSDGGPLGGHFQHAPSGAWAGECTEAEYNRCPGCLAYLTAHPQEFPETSGGLADVLPDADLARMLDEHRRLVTEKLAARMAQKSYGFGEEWARKITYTALRRVMLDTAVSYLLGGTGDPRFRKFYEHWRFAEGDLREVGYRGRLVDALTPEQWADLLRHRRPPLERRLLSPRWAGFQQRPKTAREARNDRRKKLGDAIWHEYKSRYYELREAQESGRRAKNAARRAERRAQQTPA